MKGRQIALDRWQGQEAAALLVDGRLEDLLVDADLPRLGSIYRATADRPMKGQGGLFLSTPDGPVFLRQVKGIKPGERLLVQVTGHAEPGKAVPVTQRLLFKSRYAIVTPGAPGLNVSRQIRDEAARDALLELAHEAQAEMPLPEGAGLILRSSCFEADPSEVAEDILAMTGLARQVLADSEGAPELLVEGDGPHALAWREWVAPAALDAEPGSFERHGVTEALEALSSPRVPLPGSASMMVEVTSALVAVDVNTGGDTSPAAGLKANIAALRDLPRQLRLRGLGGQIVIDPAPCPKKDRRQLEQVLKAELKRDPVETIFAGWTTLGLIELQRKRDRVALTDIR
ncbi:ribonuclease E/G [Pseudoponticoccus marisrubri]|uniref:Ribonuclease G n=1 Tax=Pseudoponticoccus marisrubri TaxID=1685382 RepID=A0A0W7WIL0_9RHOB|nr:ribonuclease E/G [Pseudoponticoccus marisrubri]KUF10393.1 ribonuclease G [Pseudoponticoccus marisrubri]